MKIARRMAVLLAIVLSVAVGIAIASAAQAGPSTPRQAADVLQQQSGDQVEIFWDDETGAPGFILGDVSRALRTPIQAQSAEETARLFFTEYRDLYGMRDQAIDLSLARVDADELGMQHVRFDQTLNGVPVFGGQLIVHLRDGRIVAVNGKYYPAVRVDTTPRLAQTDALARVRGDIGDLDAEFRADKSGLVIYMDGGQAYLTWKVNVFSWANLGNWLYFVDAADGQIVHKLNQLHEAKSVKVYDANNTSSLPGTLRCGTGVPANPTCTGAGGADLDEQGAFNNASKTYDYYKNAFNRDSYNNAGAELKSTVHFQVNFFNAFWNGAQMVYGDADTFPQAFDVVAHELTHAVTEYTSNLIYEHQPGALNESWSDVMAVLAGCSTHTATADCDFLLGETLNSGALRNLANPPAFGDPDHFNDYLWLPLQVDNGGVHINSGIPNKAFYLLTQGGTFHSVIVSGIGYTRTEQIYYRATRLYMTVKSNFFDARNSLYRACLDLIGQFSIVQANCNQVLNSWAAVGVGAPAIALPGPYKVFLPNMLLNYPAPTSCSTSSLLVNGNFDSPSPVPWVEITSLTEPIIGTPPVGVAAHSGSRLAWMGGYDDADDELFQVFTIPAGRTALEVVFYVRVGTNDSLFTPFDYLFADIRTPSDTSLFDFYVLDNTYAAAGYYKVTLTWNELLNYAGQSMRLYFNATTDFSDLTSFLVDTVSVQVKCSDFDQQGAADGQPVTMKIEFIADPAGSSAVDFSRKP